MIDPILITFESRSDTFSIRPNAVLVAADDPALHIASDSIVLRIACQNPCDVVERLHDAMSAPSGPHQRKVTLTLRDGVRDPIKARDTLREIASSEGGSQ